MGIFDIIILAMLFIGFVSGLQKGLLASLLMAAAFAVSCLLAQVLEPKLTELLLGTSFRVWIEANLETADIAWQGIFRAAGYFVAFALIYAALMLIVNLVSNVFRLPKLKGADAILGGIIGLAVAYGVVCLVVALLPIVLDPVKEGMADAMLSESKLGSFFASDSTLADLFKLGAKLAGLAK